MDNNSIKIHQGKQFEQTIEQAFQAAYKRSPDNDDLDDQEQLRQMQQYFAASDQTDLPLLARTQQMALEWRLYNITGHTADLDEALDEFENVKAAVGELFNENQALSILNRQMRLTLDFASKAMDIVERDAAMFITPKARKWIEQFRLACTASREQYTKLIAEKENDHANPTDQPND
jgi:regulator of replication initiation timing